MTFAPVDSTTHYGCFVPRKTLISSIWAQKIGFIKATDKRACQEAHLTRDPLADDCEGSAGAIGLSSRQRTRFPNGGSGMGAIAAAVFFLNVGELIRFAWNNAPVALPQFPAQSKASISVDSNPQRTFAFLLQSARMVG
jgi:hypothetical protein